MLKNCEDQVTERYVFCVIITIALVDRELSALVAWAIISAGSEFSFLPFFPFFSVSLAVCPLAKGKKLLRNFFTLEASKPDFS
jgi:hypothetical protein